MLEKIKAETLKILGPFSNFVYLLGSAGTERFTKDSDIDLAIHSNRELPFEETKKIQFSLEEALQRDVDLVVLNSIDPIFGQQVLETGRILFVNSSVSLTLWKVLQMSRYPDFKRSREVIEKSLLKRKKYV